MKIALVHIRLLHRGGLETRLFSYIEWFRKEGHEVTVIVYKTDPDIKVPEGVKLVVLPARIAPKPLRAWVFNHQLGRYLTKRKFDFVFSLGRTSHQDAVLCPGTHLGYLKSMGKKPRSFSDYMQIKMDNRAYQAPGVILAASEMMKSEVEGLYGIDGKKIRILHPPTDTERFNHRLRPERYEIREKFGFRPEEKIFVLVSASHGRKGLPLLQEVFKDMPKDVVLAVAGGQAVQETTNIRHLGFVYETEALYTAADCTVLPAVYEPYGQVVSESILCGTPVLISKMVGAKDVIRDGFGKVIDGFAVESWKAAISEMAAEPYVIQEDPEFIRYISLENHMARIMAIASAVENPA